MKSLLFVLVGLFSVASFAEHYGEAGCGLGSLVFTNPNSNQVFASTTNESTYTQLFGISSGTSNCVDHGAVAANKEVPLFIETNRTALAKDASRGTGETVVGLAHLMGCDSKAFGQSLKSNYKQIFVDTNMEATGIQKGIQTVVQNSCGA